MTWSLGHQALWGVCVCSGSKGSAKLIGSTTEEMDPTTVEGKAWDWEVRGLTPQLPGPATRGLCLCHVSLSVKGDEAPDVLSFRSSLVSTQRDCGNVTLGKHKKCKGISGL